MPSIFEKVTNVAICEFRKENESGTFTPMIDVINPENIAFVPESVKVYSFNLSAGTVKARTLNLFYSKTDSVKFVSQYLRYWYFLEHDAVQEEYAKFTKAKSESEEEIPEHLIECIEARYANAMAALAPYTSVVGVASTVALLVCADRKVKSEKWPLAIRKAFTPVETALNAINTSEHDEKAVNLKSLRDALKPFCQAVWTPTEDGTIVKYTYNANVRLTEEVFRVSMRGRERMKDGKIGTKYAKGFELIREVVYALYEELQKKDKELKMDTPKPATNESANN